MTKERAGATGESLPDFRNIYDHAIHIRELFEAMKVLSDQNQDAFALGTLTNAGSKLADSIVQNLKEIIQ